MWLQEGWKAVFRVALAVLKANEKALLSMDFDDLMPALKTLHSTHTAKHMIKVSCTAIAPRLTCFTTAAAALMGCLLRLLTPFTDDATSRSIAAQVALGVPITTARITSLAEEYKRDHAEEIAARVK